MPRHPIRFGIQTGQQDCTWERMRDFWQKVDAWGYDSLWAFDHFYPTNRFGHPDYGTHYVALAYELVLRARPTIMIDSQHSEAKWMSDVEMLSATNVHANTKAYVGRSPK